MVNIQLKDNAQAVTIDDVGKNVPIAIDKSSELVRSQKEIAKILQAIKMD